MQNIESDSEDELPPGWVEKCTDDGNVYYINPGTDKTQWTHPRTGKKKVLCKDLPFGWSQTTDDNGTTVYKNKETGNLSYIDPRLAFAKEEKAHVYDIRQKFDGSSTAFQVLHGIDLSGRYALITGSNVGIGYETAKSLARHGCSILFANRDMEATQKAIKQIVEETKASEENLKSIHLDLASLQGVKKCAMAVKTVFSDHLDVLILNAGVFGQSYTETEDHYELTFQVNHLSHMYLTLLLEPLLRKDSRVIFVSSESHRFANMKDVFRRQSISMPRDSYSAMMAYNNSKLFNVMTANVLSNEWRSKGIRVNSLHPGNLVYTGLCRSWWLYKLFFMFLRPFTKSLQQAAATTVYAAAAPELDGVSGFYFNNCFYCDASTTGRDQDLATEVFALSLKAIKDAVGSDHIEGYLKKFVPKTIDSNHQGEEGGETDHGAK